MYNKIIGRTIQSEILRRIKEDKYSPATILYHIKNYIFTPDLDDYEILKPFIE